MRAVVQRVMSARVEVGEEIVGAIERGLLAYLGFGRGDTDSDRAWMLSKIIGLRVFEEEAPAKRMTHSLADVGGGEGNRDPVAAFPDRGAGRRGGFGLADQRDDLFQLA